MHWADVVAKKLLEKKDTHVLATAITPSGPIHVGNLREVLTTEAIYRSLCNQCSARLIYIADTFDPLRRVYPFLPDSYSQYVGMPLSNIPCPCGSHDNYAAHFLEPFFSSIEELGVKPQRNYAHEMYRNGMFNKTIKIALDNANVIRDIIKTISQRDLPDSWMPFNALCESCGRLNGIVHAYTYPMISYTCSSCHTEGSVDIRIGGVGKLP